MFMHCGKEVAAIANASVADANNTAERIALSQYASSDEL
jgi:hypothetical protein